MNSRLKVILPLVVVVVGVLAAVGMVKSRSSVKPAPPEFPAPLVRAMRVSAQDHRFRVESQGSVRPRTETALAAEVSGRVLELSSAMAAGAFFEEGELLVRIDPTDYRAAMTQAEATVAQARLSLAREEEESRVAHQEWERLDGGEATSLALREPQLAQARASLASAEAALDRAARDLQRTELRAPYAGRVRQKSVDVGQYVNRGGVLGQIYAIDVAELRLPLPDEELAYLDLPLGHSAGSELPLESQAEVQVQSNFAGQSRVWKGRVVRTEGELDPNSRMVHVVAQIQDPYDRHGERGLPPLPVGLFVDAEILGSEVSGVFLVPREALRGGDRVLVVDEDDRLRLREVEILRTGRNDVVIRGGLRDGERVCLSNLDAFTDGMRVRIQDEESFVSPQEMTP